MSIRARHSSDTALKWLEGWDVGGMGMTSTFLPFSSTSLCLHFFEDPRHLSAQILMWYIILNRVVVMRMQQGLAPLKYTTFRGSQGLTHWPTLMYGNPHKRLREKGFSKASKHRCQPMAREPFCPITKYCQDKGYFVSNGRGVTFGSVSRKLAWVPPERLPLPKWAFLNNWFKTNTPHHTQNPKPQHLNTEALPATTEIVA